MSSCSRSDAPRESRPLRRAGYVASNFSWLRHRICRRRSRRCRRRPPAAPPIRAPPPAPVGSASLAGAPRLLGVLEIGNTPRRSSPPRPLYLSAPTPLLGEWSQAPPAHRGRTSLRADPASPPTGHGRARQARPGPRRLAHRSLRQPHASVVAARGPVAPARFRCSPCHLILAATAPVRAAASPCGAAHVHRVTSSSPPAAPRRP